MHDQPRAKKWELGWSLWVVLGVLLPFSLLEGRALKNGEPTLSQTVWHVSKGWPPFGWLTGVVVGFLGAHFFWPDQGLKSDGHDDGRL